MKTAKKKHNNYKTNTKKRGGVFTQEEIEPYIKLHEKFEKVENYNDLEKIDDEIIETISGNIPQGDENIICALDKSIFYLFDSKVNEKVESFKKSVETYNSIVFIQTNVVNKILEYIEIYFGSFNLEAMCKKIEQQENPTQSVEAIVQYTLDEDQLKELLREITDKIIEIIIVFIENYKVDDKSIHTIIHSETIPKEILDKITDSYVNEDSVKVIMDKLMEEISKTSICKSTNLIAIQTHIINNRRNIIQNVKNVWKYASEKKTLAIPELNKLLFFNKRTNPSENNAASRNIACVNSTKYLNYNKVLALLNDENPSHIKILSYFITMIQEADINKLFVNLRNNKVLKAMNSKIYFLSQDDNKYNKFYNYIHNILEEIENYKYDYYLNEPGKYNLIYFNLQQMFDDMSCYDNILKLKSSLLMNTLTIKLIISINKEIIKMMFVNILNICLSFKSLSLTENEYKNMETRDNDITYRTKLYFIIKEVSKIYDFVEKNIFSDIEYEKIIYFIENFKKRKMSEEEIKNFWKISEEEYKPKLFDIEEREFWNEQTVSVFELATTVVTEFIPFFDKYDKIIEISSAIGEMVFEWQQFETFTKPKSVYNDVWNEDESKEKMKSQNKFNMLVKKYADKMNQIEGEESKRVYNENLKEYKETLQKEEQNKYFITDPNIQCQIDIVIEMLEQLNVYINENVNKYYFLLEICNFIGKKCEDKNIRKHDYGYQYTKEYADEAKVVIVPDKELSNNYSEIIKLINKLKELVTRKTEISIKKSNVPNNEDDLSITDKLINESLNNLMNAVVLLPHRKTIDNDEKLKDINTFYNVITNLTSETRTEINDINVESYIDLDGFLNKYLYTENSDKDNINDVEDIIPSQTSIFKMTTESGNLIQLDFYGELKYLNRAFMLGNKMYQIYVESPDTARNIKTKNILKLSNFMFYLYQLYKMNLDNSQECHSYNILKQKFFIVLDNKERAKTFFQWFKYYNKGIFIAIVNVLCSVTKDIRDFNLEYPYLNDDLTNINENPINDDVDVLLERLKQSKNKAQIVRGYIDRFKKVYGTDIVNTIKNKYPNADIYSKDGVNYEKLKEFFEEIVNTDASKSKEILCYYDPYHINCNNYTLRIRGGKKIKRTIKNNLKEKYAKKRKTHKMKIKKRSRKYQK